MKYILLLVDFLFGCPHKSLSRVFTISKRSYRVCCDCGAEFDYSWETMSSKPRNISPVWKLSSERWKNAVQGT